MKRQALVLLGLLLLANFLLVWGQNLVALWGYRGRSFCLMPESRYYVQILIALLPAIPLVALRHRHGRKALALLTAGLVVHAAVFLAKPHIPGSRRNQYLAACDWAVEKIHADYQGPVCDAVPFFSPNAYHPSGRPVVDAHVKRVPYLLGGRPASLVWCFPVDIPDYIVDEPHRVNRDLWAVADYETLDERTFGQRKFVIYKRVR